MRKFILMAVLMMFAGYVHATNIQQFVEPKSGGPLVWTESIYNASNTDLGAGDVVIWTIADSTGDNDLWVTTTTGGATNTTAGKQAGVVWPNAITSGNVGSIAIWGVGVAVDVMAGVTTAGDELCAGTTAGAAKECLSTDAGIYSSFGICLSTPASDSCVAKINAL